LIILAVGSTGLRLILVEIPSYKAELESQLGEILDIPLKIGKLRARMRGINPEVILKDITILDHDSETQAIQFREIRLGINVFDILKKQDLFSSAWISLVGAKLTVKRNHDGTFAVVGLKANDEQPFWLMQGGRYEILDSEVSWRDDMRQAETQVIQHVNITLNNLSENEHQLRMHANLPEKFGKKLTLMIDFSGDIFTKGIFNGTLYAKGQKVFVSELFSSEMPTNFMLESGETDFQLWSEWKNSKMVNVTGDVRIKNGSVVYQKTQPLPIDDLVAEFRWQRQADQWQLDVSRLSLDSGKRIWPEASFSVAVDVNQKLVAAIDQLDLSQASELLLFARILDAKHAKSLKKSKLHGQLNNLVVFGNLNNSDFAVNGEVKDLSFSAIESLPTVQGFSGWVKGTEQKGQMLLATKSAKIKLPKMFRRPLEISSLYGYLDWQKNEENWLISSQNMKLKTPDININNRFRITIPKQQKTSFIDWQTVLIGGHDVIHSKKYFPVRRMQKPVANWLDQLLTAGRVTQGKIVYYGNSSDFPFTKGNGIFHAELDVAGVGLSFNPEWPSVSDLNANVQFHNDKILVASSQGRLSGAKITKLKTNVLSAWGKDTFLDIKGQVQGTIEQSFDFLLNSPLASMVEPISQMITPQGGNILDLSLKIPVTNVEQAKVDIVAHLNKAKLTVLSMNLPITDIKGDLIISGQNISSQKLEGVSLGYPVMFDISSNHEKTMINAQGETDVQSLQEQFPMPYWRMASGNFGYDLQLTLPDDENSTAHLLLQSDLQGLELDLPEDLAKAAEHKKNLRLDFDLNDTDLMSVNINYADQLKLAAKIDRKKTALYSANLVYGAGNADFISEPGINLSINNEELNVDDWMSLTEKDQAASSLFTQLNAVNIKLDKLNWNNQLFGKVDLALKKTDSFLSGRINTPYFNGKLSIPSDHGKQQKVLLDLKKLDITALNQLSSRSTEAMPLSPEDIPLIDLKSEKVLWQGNDLGTLDFQTQRSEHGIAFTKFEIKSKNSHLTTEVGHWEAVDAEQTSSLKGKWQVKNLGLFLSNMQMTDELMDTKSVFRFDFKCPGSPFQFSLPKLTGTVNARLQEGRLLGIEPGLGRVLGALDLWRLDRRMRLDFSDLFLKGLSYDDIRGDLSIVNGKTNTDNLIIDAASAKIKITGETNLVKRTFNQDIFVIPKTAEVIPIAGKIVGGVVGGVAETITGKSQEGMFFGAHYKIQGPWDKPDVISQPENDGLLRKVWSGITGFPWIKSEKTINKAQ
jgi:uncharacterized protein (TIGR02099 family)